VRRPKIASVAAFGDRGSNGGCFEVQLRERAEAGIVQMKRTVSDTAGMVCM